jgi:hypothetical protein
MVAGVVGSAIAPQLVKRIVPFRLYTLRKLRRSHAAKFRLGHNAHQSAAVTGRARTSIMFIGPEIALLQKASDQLLGYRDRVGLRVT